MPVDVGRLRGLLDPNQIGDRLDATAAGGEIRARVEEKDPTTVVITDSRADKPVNYLRGQLAKVTRLNFSPGGRFLAIARADGSVTLWESATGTERATLRGHATAVDRLAFSADGQVLATGSATAVRLWDTASGAPRAQKEFLPMPEVVVPTTTNCRWALSPNGCQVALAWDDGTLHFWDVPSGRERISRGKVAGLLHCLVFAPDGRTVATGGTDFTVRLWDVASGEPTSSAECTGNVLCLAFSRDGKRLVAGTQMGAIYFWELEHNRLP
jgi:WD40 repeat protein